MKTGPGRRWRRAVSAAVAAVAIALLAQGCIPPPKSIKQTKRPRPGSAAGGRVAVVYSRHYQINLGGFERIHPHPQRYSSIYLKLLTDGVLVPGDVYVPEEITAAQVRLVHTQGFVDSLADSSAVARYLEVAPLAALPNGLVDAGVTAAFRRCSGGTLLAGRLALRHGIAVNVGGGYHHARPAAGEGFCIYNDLAIAVRTLQDERLIRRAMVVDLDVHQGNGTATCFAGDDAVFLLDMYQDSIYPQPKVPVDMAIPLRAGTDGREYLRLLRNQLPEALWQGRPDIVFIQGGADVLAGDQLGGLKLTPQELVDRDAVVIDACRAADIPVVLTLGGGYQQDAWRAQAASIRRTVLTHGTPDGQPPHRPRKPTGKEKYFTR